MSTRPNRAFALKASLAVTLAVAVSGCVLVGPSSGGARSGAGDVVACHKGKTLTLPQSALAAHLGHGDHRGPC